MLWGRNVIIQGLTDDTLLCHPIPPQSREGSPCSQYPSIKCIQTCVCVLASGGKVWVEGGEKNGRLIGWGLGASHPVPQGLRRIILCLFTGYVSGSGSWVSMEAPSTPSQPLSEGSHLGLPGLVDVSFSTKTEWGGVSSTPDSIFLSLSIPCLEACYFCSFLSSPGAKVHPSTFFPLLYLTQSAVAWLACSHLAFYCWSLASQLELSHVCLCTYPMACATMCHRIPPACGVQCGSTAL